MLITKQSDDKYMYKLQVIFSAPLFGYHFKEGY